MNDQLVELAPRTRHHRKRWFSGHGRRQSALTALPPVLERRRGLCEGMESTSPEFYCCMKDDSVESAKLRGRQPPGSLLRGSVSDAPATVGKCVEAMTNCLAVMINVEGSDDTRRRANTQNNLNAFAVNCQPHAPPCPRRVSAEKPRFNMRATVLRGRPLLRSLLQQGQDGRDGNVGGPRDGRLRAGHADGVRAGGDQGERQGDARVAGREQEGGHAHLVDPRSDARRFDPR